MARSQGGNPVLSVYNDRRIPMVVTAHQAFPLVQQSKVKEDGSNTLFSRLRIVAYVLGSTRSR